VSLAAVGAWTASGRLAVTTTDDAFSARLLWEQHGGRYQIRLTGPLGQGMLELSGDPGHAELRTAEDERSRAASAEALLESRVGWSVPVAGLRYWLRGIPSPDEPPSAVEIDPSGRLARLEQSGWVIEYQRYGEFGAWVLPTRMRMVNERVRARVVLGRWEL
jgi:outer membrane lipoprotein LolB